MFLDMLFDSLYRIEFLVLWSSLEFGFSLFFRGRGLNLYLMMRITWEKQVAHLVCVVRGGKGDPQEVRVVLHSERRRI